MKSVIQEVYRDIGIRHPIIHKIRDEKLWEPLYESLTRVASVRSTIYYGKSGIENDSDS